jgi:hypothetical protein
VTARSVVFVCAVILASIASVGAHLRHADAAEARVVEVAIAGSPDDAAALSASLKELLGRLGLETRIVDASAPASPASSSSAVARVGIDLRSSTGAYVVLTDTRAARPAALRSIARTNGGSQTVLLEEVAHVVQAAVESMLAAAPPAASAAPPAPSSSPPPEAISPPGASEAPRDAAPASHVTWSLDLATFASGMSMARDADVVFGAGGGARADLGRGAWRPALWLLGAYHVPFGANGTRVDLRASVWSVRLLPAVTLFESKRFLLELAGGPGLDIFALSSSNRPPPNTRVDANRTDVSLVASSMLAAHVGMGRGSELLVAGVLDWDLSPREYVMVGESHDTLLRLLRFRAGVSVGFTFDVAGSGDAP